MKAELKIIHPNGSIENIQINQNEMTIGRENSDININDPKISRRHAIFCKFGNIFKIKDLASSNGTFVNGKKITETVLDGNDRIAMGNTNIVLRINSHTRELKFSDDTVQLDAMNFDLIHEISESGAESLKRAKSDLAALYRTARKISALVAPEEFYTIALDIVLQEIPAADCCSIHKPGKDSNLECMGIKYKNEQLNTSEAPVFSRTIIDCVTEQMKAVLIFDAQSDYRLERADSIAGLNIKSAMSVPLKGAHGLVGIMQANTLLPKHRFNRDDLKLFTAIAYQIGTALENSLLYDRLENEKSALDQANRKLKSAQEHILQNEKLAAVGQLTAGIVHDIKNPMTVIYGHAKIVSTLLETNGAEKVIDGVDILESLREIEGGVNHCNDIINNLLQFSKESPPDKAAADINAITRGTLEFLKHEFKKRSITLRADLDEALPPVLVDVNQIKQVLLNIIINALQAVENHGTISIMTFHIPAAKENYTAVRIRDNGPGMTEEIKRKIFDPFFTTKESSAMECGGSGLGLSMCYGIIQNHGGQIEVESEPGKGTEFTVMLPVSEKMNQCYTTTSTVTDIRTL